MLDAGAQKTASLLQPQPADGHDDQPTDTAIPTINGNATVTFDA